MKEFFYVNTIQLIKIRCFERVQYIDLYDFIDSCISILDLRRAESYHT